MLPCFGFGWGDYQLTTYPVDSIILMMFNVNCVSIFLL